MSLGCLGADFMSAAYLFQGMVTLLVPLQVHAIALKGFEDCVVSDSVSLSVWCCH